MKNSSKLITALIVLIIVIALVNVFIVSKGVTKGGALNTSSHILELTQPVTNVSGKVVSKDTNTITVSIMPNIATSDTTKAPKSFDMTFTINDKTQVMMQQPASVPYLIKKPSNAVNGMQKTGIDSINEGDMVTLVLEEDLRVTKQSKPVVTSINISPEGNTLSGVISSVQGSTITVKGQIMNPGAMGQTLKQETYTVEVTSDTEISVNNTLDPTKAKPEELKISELKANTPVTIYFEKGQSGNLRGLLVQPLFTLPAQQSAPSQAASTPTITPGVSVNPTGAR